MRNSASDRIRELLDQAQEGVIQTILAEQSADGRWITMQGSLSRSSNEDCVWSGEVENIGLHTFVVEQLLTNWIHVPGVRSACIRGLAAIASDAVHIDGKYFWRWLKTPTRPDFMYDPDYDDTSRAIATLSIGKSLLSRDEWTRAAGGLDAWDFSVDLADSVVEDLCIVNSELQPIESANEQLRAVFTFRGGFAAKGNNTVDPIVNANVLYAIAVCERSHRSSKSSTFILQHIKEYLLEIIRRNRFIFPRFPEFSHYYLSPCFFAYVFAQSRNVVPELVPNDSLCNLAEGVIRFTSERQISREDAAWALGTLAAAGVTNSEMATRCAEQILSGFDPVLGITEPAPIYRHKRLDNFYGSKACSTLFCLEGLNNYLSIVQNDAKRLTTKPIRPSASAAFESSSK